MTFNEAMLILGLKDQIFSSTNEIRGAVERAFRRKCIESHPDKHVDKTPEQREELENQFKQLGNAKDLVITTLESKDKIDEFREYISTSVIVSQANMSDLLVSAVDDKRWGDVKKFCGSRFKPAQAATSYALDKMIHCLDLISRGLSGLSSKLCK